MSASVFKLPEIGVAGLHELQYKGVRFQMAAKRCINGGNRGTGKSGMTIAAIDALNLYPALIITTASLKLKFAGEFHYWLPKEKEITILNGQIPQDFDGKYATTYVRDRGEVRVPINQTGADVIITNYNILWHWAQNLGDLKYKCIVADEGHRLVDLKSQQHNAACYLSDRVQLVNGRQHIYVLTADIFVNYTKDLVGILKFIKRLDDFGGEWGFKARFCALQKEQIVSKRTGTVRWITNDKGASNLDELHKRLVSSCYFRLHSNQMYPDKFKEHRSVVPIEISNRTEYQIAEKDLLPYIEKLAILNTEHNNKIASISDDEIYNEGMVSIPFYDVMPREEVISKVRQQMRYAFAQTKAYNALKAPALARLGVLRRLTAKGKVLPILKWIQEFGQAQPKEKLVVFSHNREAQQEFVDAMAGCARLKGGDTPQNKADAINRFDTDPKCMRMLSSMEGGAEGNDMDAAKNVIIAELPFTAKTLGQCIDRLARMKNPHEVYSHIFIAPHTSDIHILPMLERKHATAMQIQDGKANEVLLTQSIEDDVLMSFVQQYMKSQEKQV